MHKICVYLQFIDQVSDILTSFVMEGVIAFWQLHTPWQIKNCLLNNNNNNSNCIKYVQFNIIIVIITIIISADVYVLCELNIFLRHVCINCLCCLIGCIEYYD